LQASDRIASGADYLRKTLSRLRLREDGPREVKWEGQTEIAGLVYDRLSLKRTWEGGEIQMTYWVAVKRDYAIVVAGSYNSSEGLQAIEALLAGVSGNLTE
jgi:hypothetical protein